MYRKVSDVPCTDNIALGTQVRYTPRMRRWSRASRRRPRASCFAGATRNRRNYPHCAATSSTHAKLSPIATDAGHRDAVPLAHPHGAAATDAATYRSYTVV
eukprot:2795572-Pleurochrysis_carterae.AAC.3